MRGLLRVRPSPAMVVALLALFMACAGTVVAGTGVLTKKKVKRIVTRQLGNSLALATQANTQPVSLTNNADFVPVSSLTVRGPASQYMVTAFAQLDNSACPGPATATARITFDGASFATYPDMGITVPPSVLAPVATGGLIDPDAHSYAAGATHTIALLVKVAAGINQPQGCTRVASRNLNVVRLSE